MKNNESLRLTLLSMAFPLIAIIIIVLVTLIPEQEEGWYVGQRADGIHMVQMDNGKNAEAMMKDEVKARFNLEKKSRFNTIRVIMERDSNGNLVIVDSEIK